MPLGDLVLAMDPPPPEVVAAGGEGLRHRDFLTVALVVPEAAGFPDNWIYVHSPEVSLGRIQNFGAWSPWMVQPGWTCLGLEYFVNGGDEEWSMADEELIGFAADELSTMGLLARGGRARLRRAHARRTPSTTPATRTTSRLRGWLEEHTPNVHPVGRNGMHRYNNQDHSMLTAMLAVENILDGAGHDLWAVNVDEEYHEERSTDEVEWSGLGRPRRPDHCLTKTS